MARTRGRADPTYKQRTTSKSTPSERRTNTKRIQTSASIKKTARKSKKKTESKSTKKVKPSQEENVVRPLKLKRRLLTPCEDLTVCRKSGDIVVAGRHSITIFSQNLKVKRRIRRANLTTVRIAVNSNEQIIAAAVDKHLDYRIEVFSKEGELVHEIRGDEFGVRGLKYVDCDPNNTVYVTDSIKTEIYNSSFELVHKQPAREFRVQGDKFCITSFCRLEVYKMSGQLLEDINTGSNHIVCVHMDSGDQLLVSSLIKTNTGSKYIILYRNPKGELERLPLEPPDEFDLISAIDKLPNGDLVVADSNSQQVSIFGS